MIENYVSAIVSEIKLHRKYFQNACICWYLRALAQYRSPQ